jgi:hypothetical protein
VASIRERADETGRQVLLGVLHFACKPRLATFDDLIRMLGFRNVQVLGKLEIPGAQARVAAKCLQLFVVSDDVQLQRACHECQLLLDDAVGSVLEHLLHSIRVAGSGSSTEGVRPHLCLAANALGNFEYFGLLALGQKISAGQKVAADAGRGRRVHKVEDLSQMINFEQEVNGLVLAVLSNVKRDDYVHELKKVVGGLRRLRL